MLSLQIIIKKINSSMQNILEFILIFNVYIYYKSDRVIRLWDHRE